MEGTYPVFYQQQSVGKIEVMKRGLYYSFYCRCRMKPGIVCRLVAKWPNAWENLGIPVPQGDGLELNRKLPVKRLGEEAPEFILIPHDEDIHEALFGTASKEEEQEKIAPIPKKPETEAAAPTTVHEPVETTSEHEEGTPVREEPEECPAAEEESPREVSGESGEFYPIETDQPFEHLEVLEQGILTSRDGQTGVFVPNGTDQISSDSPTGQWSEPITSE